MYAIRSYYGLPYQPVLCNRLVPITHPNGWIAQEPLETLHRALQFCSSRHFPCDPAQVDRSVITSYSIHYTKLYERVLEDLGYVRQLNEGVNRIYESMEKSMLSKPEYKETHNTVYLTLRNKISNHSKTISERIIDLIGINWNKFNATQHQILVLLFTKQQLTLDQLVEQIGINKNTIRSYLNMLIELEIIEKVSTKQRDKNAKYRFRK